MRRHPQNTDHASKWLRGKITLQETETEKILTIPIRDDGHEYSVESLYHDQLEVVCVVLNTLHEFLHIEDLNQFKPLRIILNGQGGSGKSVVIDTVVAVMRKMFGINDVVKVFLLQPLVQLHIIDRKSTRLNSSHLA